MDIEKYLEDMKSIQVKFLEFIENNDNDDEEFQNLYSILKDKRIRDNKHNLRLFLHHVASVCTNHHRYLNFFVKIRGVLQIFKDDIKKLYLNSEIFNIFKKNKRILLLLIEENMLIFDEYVAKAIIKRKYVNNKYPQYFAPELKPFMNKSWFPKYDPNSQHTFYEWVEEIKKDLPDNFHELRKIGENESYICQLIRNDNARDFIAHVNQRKVPLNSLIELSIYETNAFLIKKQNGININDVFSPLNQNKEKGVTLIEYAAFFGAIQIIRYFQMEGEEINPSLWIYAIHSQNAELIHFLEDCHVEPTTYEEKSYNGCLSESIKCNHNGIADYFLDNFIRNDDQISNVTFIQSLKYYNFVYIQKEHVNVSLFYQFCKYDYYLLVADLLTNKDININNRIILNHIFQ